MRPLRLVVGLRGASIPSVVPVLFLLGLTPGCAPGPFDGSLEPLAAQDLPDLSPAERRTLDQARAGHAVPGPYASGGDAGERVGPPPAGVEEYVRIATERNPMIRAAEQRVLRLKERIAQVTSLDDPMLQIAPVGDMAQTAAGEVQVMSSVSQRLPFPGKLAARGRIAGQDVAVAEQDLQRVRLSVVADTRDAYWSLYYAARAIEVNRRNRELLSQLREVAQAKYRAGAATQESVLRASVEMSNLDSELMTLEQRRVTAVAMLNTMMDRPVQASLADPRAIELSHFDARLSDLLASARNDNPEIRSIREQVGRYREQRELARLGGYPDFTVSLSYNLVDDGGLSPVANGDDQWWLGLGVNLPIWRDRVDAARREATRGILEASGMLAGERNRVAFRVQDAFAKVQTRQEQARLLSDVIVPQASQALEASFSGYRAGEVDFLTLIDNWRKLLDFQLLYQASLAELERSVARLEEVVGRDLDRSAPADEASIDPVAPAAAPGSETKA